MRGYFSGTMPRKAAEFWWNILKKPNEKRFIPEKNVAYYKKDMSSGKWNTIIWEEVLNERREKQQSILSSKRRIYTLIKPCYIWVFYNDTDLFGGWWLYIKTLKEDYALNFRTTNDRLLKKIMNEVNVGIIPFDFYMWAEAFEKKYHHEGFKRKKQGLLRCWCIIENNRVTDIILN